MSWEAVHKVFTAEPGQYVYLKSCHILLLCFMNDRADKAFIVVNGTQLQRMGTTHPSSHLEADTPESDVVIGATVQINQS